MNVATCAIALMLAARFSLSVADAAGGPTIGVLAKAERALTAAPLPPFVEYTVSLNFSADASDWHAREPQRYRVRLRTSDHAALVTEEDGYHERQGLRFMRPAFYDGDIPSPFLIDIFRAAPRTATVEPFVAPSIQPLMPIAESYTSQNDRSNDANLIRLRVSPRDGDREKYRLRGLDLDPVTFSVRTARVIDNITEESSGRWIADTDSVIVPAVIRGLQVVSQIDEYELDEYGHRSGGMEIHFRLSEFTFSQTMPEWYFEPSLYGAHMGERPD